VRRPAIRFALPTVLAAVALAACGGSGDSSSDTATFESDDYPFTFDYPGDWQETDDVTLNKQLGSLRAQNVTGVSPGEGTNGIYLATYEISQPVTEDNIDQAKQAFEQLVQQADPSARGTAGDVGGFPSVTIDAVPVSDPAGAKNTLIAMFDGTTQYLLSCQWGEEDADEIESACDEAQSTLQRRS
jgi:hypothetical protein